MKTKYDANTINLARTVNNLFYAINTTRSCSIEEMWKGLEEFGVTVQDIELSNKILDDIINQYNNSLLTECK